MYHKVHVENSRNKTRGVIDTSGDNSQSHPGFEYDMDRGSKYQTMDREAIANKQRSGAALMDLLYRQASATEVERDLTVYPKNDYAPPFVSSLNFNFNMNDVFGSGKQGSASTSNSKPPIAFKSILLFILN
jgi:hypothetical protein